MKPIQVLIADDHELFRDGLKTLISSAPDMALVAEAASGAEAIQLAANHRPDVVLLDIQMPEMNGVEAARQIVAANPAAKVLMLTMFDDDHSVLAAMRAGARGYILKGVKRAEMLRAIQAVAGGEAIFSPGIAERMMAFFGQIRLSPPATLFPDLTEREREVLALLTRDYKNADIARELVISPKTVRNHVSSILSKLQAADRAEASRQARAAGLG
jgi:DNA-binding NarL/FixJ family response regulator